MFFGDAARLSSPGGLAVKMLDVRLPSMVAKKKNKKKQTKSATPSRKKAPQAIKTTKKKPAAGKKKASKTAPKGKSAKKAAITRRAAGTKTSARKPALSPKKRGRKRTQDTRPAFSREPMETGSGGQSGDLQGLSSIERADSESVDELLEEGNAFEADVVKGVEDADDADEREVRTHEVPEDDVPDEYLEP